MNENRLTKVVLDAAFRVHTRTGPGLLETVNEVILAHKLQKSGLNVDRQKPIMIRYDDLVFEEEFRADLLVENRLIVELNPSSACNPSTGNNSCPNSA